MQTTVKRRASTTRPSPALRPCAASRSRFAARTIHNKYPGAWLFDANNRLTQRGSGACGSVGTVCYAYDEAGNLQTKTEGAKLTRYAYDTLNRLVEVKNGADQPIARYGYDPLSRRLWKEQYRDQDGNALAAPRRTTYLYADEGLIAEATQAISLNADGSVSASQPPVISTQYGPRPDAPFTTGALFIKTHNSKGLTTIAYYHHDHLGTPIQATDKTGRVVWAADYNAFGLAMIITPAATDAAPTITSNLRLPGQYWDDESGLHYNWHRYYDGATGRYIQSDPIGLAGGLNRYAYVGGNPVSWVDPWGLARIGSRPLNDERLPTGINGRGLLRHDQIWYDDSSSNSGFFDNNRVRDDDGHTRSEYDFSRDPKFYNDSLMRQAEKNVKRNWDMSWQLGKNDCQSYVDEVRIEYDRLSLFLQRHMLGRRR